MAETSVTCWRDAAELFPIHLSLHTSVFTKDTVKISLSTFLVFIVNKFKPLRQYETEKNPNTYIDYGGKKKLSIPLNTELNTYHSVIFCKVEPEVKA